MVNNASGNYANSMGINYWNNSKDPSDTPSRSCPGVKSQAGGDCWQPQEPAKKNNSFWRGLFVKGPVDMVKSLFTLNGAAMAIGGVLACIAFPVVAPVALSAIALGAGGYQMIKGFSKGDKTRAGVGAFTALTGLVGGYFGCKAPNVVDKMPIYHDETGFPLANMEGEPLNLEHVFRDPNSGHNRVWPEEVNGKRIFAPRDNVFQYYRKGFTNMEGKEYPAKWVTQAKFNPETGEWATLEEMRNSNPDRDYMSVGLGRHTGLFKGADGKVLVDPIGLPIGENYVYQHPLTQQNEIFEFIYPDGDVMPIQRQYLKYNEATKQVEPNLNPEKPDEMLEVPEAGQLKPGKPMNEDSVAEHLNIQPKQNLQNAFETLRQGTDGDTGAAARIQPFKKPFATLPETLSTSYGYRPEEQAS